MKLLAIADRPPERPILELVKQNLIDLIVTLGDLELYEIGSLEHITHIPKIGVYGNHCSGNYFEQLGITNMHLRTWEYMGLKFGGFEGCVRYKERGSFMYTQDECSQLLKNFPKVDVMLTHCPPFGINDDQTEESHTGFIGLKTYINNYHPKYLLHGHTYPKDPEAVQELSETQIIYVHANKFIDII